MTKTFLRHNILLHSCWIIVLWIIMLKMLQTLIIFFTISWVCITGSYTLTLMCSYNMWEELLKWKYYSFMAQLQGSLNWLATMIVVSTQGGSVLFLLNGIGNRYMFVYCLQAWNTPIWLNETWETAQGCASAVVCIYRWRTIMHRAKLLLIQRTVKLVTLMGQPLHGQTATYSCDKG